MSWINYLLEANLYLALFYGAYYLLLRRETFYQLNRAYLLGSSTLAFIIPLFQLGILKPVPVAIQNTEPLTELYTSPAAHFATIPVMDTPPPAPTNYYLLAYGIIAGIMAVSFIFRVIQLARLARKGKHSAGDKFHLIEMEDNENAFSFFGYLFISKKLTTSGTIIQHELVHIRQRHSLDIVYLELVKIICWFNPAVYLLQNSIRELHEYIADSHIADAQQDVHQYTDFLISNAYGLSETALTNNFFNKNLLKKRIMMLHQKKSGGLARLKLLVALPLLGAMLCLSTLGFTKDYRVFDLAPRYKADSVVKRSPPPPPAPPTKLAKPTSPPPPAPAPPTPKIAPPPSAAMYSYLQSAVKYPEDAFKNKKQGMVYAGFRIDANHLVTNAKVINSVDAVLDAEVLDAIKAYKGVSTDKPGDYAIGVSFDIDKRRPNGQVSIMHTKADKNGMYPPPPPPLRPAAPPMAVKMPPPPPPPMEPMKNTFLDLAKHMGNTIKYPKAALDKKLSAAVAANFRIDAEGKIGDVKIAQGAGAGLDDAVVKALLTYKKKVADKPGTYTIGVDFLILEQQKVPSLNKGVKNDNYVGTVEIDDMPNGPAKAGIKPPPPPMPPAAVPDAGKGGNISYIVDPNTYSYAKLKQLGINFYKQGYVFDFKEINHGTDSVLLALSLVALPGSNWDGHGGGAATFRVGEMKKSDYVIAVGVDADKKITFVHSVKRADAEAAKKKPAKAPGVVVPPPPPPVAPTDGTVLQNTYDKFYDYLGKSIHYPREARVQNIGGKVFAVFNVNDDNSITNVGILRGLTNAQNDEVVRCIKAFKVIPAMKPGINYTIPISFDIVNEADGKEIKGNPYINPSPTVRGYKSTGFKNVALKEIVVTTFSLAKPPPPPPTAPKTGKVVLPGRPNNTIARANDRKDTSYQDRFGRLYANIKYPPAAVENHAEGPVWATFTVDAGHHIQNIKMYGGNKDLMDEVKSQMVACNSLPAARVGASYTLPVRFALQDKDGVDIDPPAKPGLGWEIGSMSKTSHQFFWPVFLDQVVVKAREI